MSRPHAGNWRSSFEHVDALVTRMRLAWLLRHFSPRLAWAAYVGINGFVTIGILALLALVSGSPFLFPSLGPTAYMFFFAPMSEASSPRNAVFGHAIGLICGYGAFALAMSHSPHFPMRAGIHVPGVLAAALSLSATGALMVLFGVSHPPAGATTLIVSLGIISQPKDLVIIEVAVVLLTVQSLLINRLAGLPYPLWRSQKSETSVSQSNG
jgi:CBS-domain-containing membrane protein